MPSFRLTLAYDGTEFAGSQVQPNQRTVQGVLESVLGGMAGVPVRARFAGRTDRGVHAAGQIAAVSMPAWRTSPGDLQRALNAGLPSDLGATNAAVCAESFDPRFDAEWREYRYWIAPGVINPFLGRYAWTRRMELDAEAVRAGALRLVGKHDFASFAGGGEGVPWSSRATKPRGTIRTVFRCECYEIQTGFGPGGDGSAKLLEVRVVADGFLPQMVRNIVGALVQLGQGRRQLDWIGELLATKDRRAGPVAAPPRGLTLSRVGFNGDSLDDD